MTIFSLVAVFSATIAWFTLNQQVGADGMFISAENKTAYRAGLTIHRCVMNESTKSVLSFNFVGANSSQYKIDDYSQLNPSQPVLLLFPLGTADMDTGLPIGVNASSVSLKIESELDEAYADVNTSNPSAPNYYSRFPFSSVCCFRVVAWSGEVPTNAEDNPSRYYVNFGAIGSNDPRCYVGETQSFVTAAFNSLTWNGSSLVLFDGSTLANASTTTIKYLGVVIDYYQPALSVVFRAGGYLGPNPLTFLMDFSMVIS